ncbi:MAG: inositol monophosphatase [Actinobacteria bacterium]|nr:inositol monophosphatase [Actinomycetota bacterium]
MSGLVVPAGVDVRDLEAIAVDIATSAGRLVVDDRPRDLGVAATKSSVTDIVTVMDQRSQDHLLARLDTLRPMDAVMGEEKGGRAGTSGITWVVDPIDGTVNYLYDLPAYAVSVAAVVGDPSVPGAWQPIAAAVVNPVSGETFRAALGRGALRRSGAGVERRLEVGRAASTLADTLVATGFSYAASTRAEQAGLLVELLPEVRDIRRIGSAALDLCRLAAGEVDAYYERALNPWDLAAGWLVVTEAGCLVGGPGGLGSAPTAGLTWAAQPAIAQEFTARVTTLARRHHGS